MFFCFVSQIVHQRKEIVLIGKQNVIGIQSINLTSKSRHFLFISHSLLTPIYLSHAFKSTLFKPFIIKTDGDIKKPSGFSKAFTQVSRLYKNQVKAEMLELI